MKENEMTYEQAMAELEKISSQIEHGDLGIDKMAAQLKEAQRLIDFCRKQLFHVDAEIKDLLAD